MGKGKYTPRSLAVRIIVNLIGIIITAYGAEAFVLANLGSDPVTAFVQGLGNVLGMPFGNAMNVFNIVFFVIILIVYRKGIGIGTVLYTFLLGTFCTIMDPYIVAAIGPEPTLVTRILLVVTGTLALGVGLGGYQAAGIRRFQPVHGYQAEAEAEVVAYDFRRLHGRRRSDHGRRYPRCYSGRYVPGRSRSGSRVQQAVPPGQQVGRQRRPRIQRSLISSSVIQPTSGAA